MTFKELYKDELWEAVRHYKIDVDVNANKNTLATALLDNGISPEQWQEDKAAKDGQPRPVTTTEDLKADSEELLPEPEDLDEEEPVVEEEDEEEKMVLVRFIGRNRSYSVGKWSFGIYRPFALMTREEFNGLDRKLFREGTKAEAREYFG